MWELTFYGAFFKLLTVKVDWRTGKVIVDIFLFPCKMSGIHGALFFSVLYFYLG